MIPHAWFRSFLGFALIAIACGSTGGIATPLDSVLERDVDDALLDELDDEIERQVGDRLDATLDAVDRATTDALGRVEEILPAADEEFFAALDPEGFAMEKAVWVILATPRELDRIERLGLAVRERRRLDAVGLVLLRVEAPRIARLPTRSASSRPHRGRLQPRLSARGRRSRRRCRAPPLDRVHPARPASRSESSIRRCAGARGAAASRDRAEDFVPFARAAHGPWHGRGLDPRGRASRRAALRGVGILRRRGRQRRVDGREPHVSGRMARRARRARHQHEPRGTAEPRARSGDRRASSSAASSSSQPSATTARAAHRCIQPRIRTSWALRPSIPRSGSTAMRTAGRTSLRGARRRRPRRAR